MGRRSASLYGGLEVKIYMHSSVFYPSVGGVETVGELLVAEWAKAGVELRLSTDTAGPASFGGFPVIRKPRMREVLASVRWADVVFHNHPATRCAWAPRLLRKPWFATVHTWLPMYRNDGGVKRQMQAWLQRRLLAGCRLIAVSGAVANHLPQNRAVVLSNPCRFPYEPNSNAHSREIDVLYVGRLVSDKGVDILIDALALLASEGLFLRTKVIGDGPLKAELAAKIAGGELANWVEWAGTLPGDSLQSNLASARYTVVPSRWEEPFGLVAIEALACGSVPIVANSGGLPEAVGPHGVVFPSGDVNALAAELRRIAQHNNRHDLGESDALKAWMLKHDPTTVAARYLEVFREAV